MVETGIVTFFVEILRRIGWKGLINWLFRRGPRGLRISAALFLVISIIASFWWWWNTKDVQYRFAQILRTPLEATSQSYKGLEAFTLAGLDESIRSSLKNATVSEPFVQVSQEFDSALSKGSGVLPPLRIMPKAGLAVMRTYISDSLASDGGHGFLFVPATILRVSPPSNTASEEQIKRAVVADSQLSTEIRASVAIASKVCDLGAIPVFSGVPELFGDTQPVTPVQSYFITRSGLMRICESKTNNEASHYEEQFLANTFFPDRPYFSATMNRFPTPTAPQAGQPLEKSLWITKPYIDLGGNGIVVTMSRRTNAPGLSESALFLDISLGTAAENFVRRRVETFGGKAIPITCSTSPPVSCSGELSLEERGLLNHELSQISPLSEIFGKIHVFSYNQPQQITFTIPLSRDFATPNGQYTLLYCIIDLERARFWNAAKAAVAGGSFLLFIFLVGAVIADFGLQLRGQERAFTTFSNVMERAPVAYCRLDEQDEFLDVNGAFLAMLGFRSKEELLKEFKMFVDLLANEESRRTYVKIQSIRKGKTPESSEADSYSLQLWKAGHSETKGVVVYGGTVPAPKSARQKMPQTFAILMELHALELLYKPPTDSNMDISGDWQYECVALDRRYAHGGKLTIEMQMSKYGPQWRLVGTRQWRTIDGIKEQNIDYVWNTDWAAFTEKDRIKYTYRTNTEKGPILGFADGAITGRENDKPTEISGMFYQLAPIEPMHGHYKFSRSS